MRLDNFLTALLPDQSRSHIQRLIKDGRVTGPMATLRASTMVHAGQVFVVEIPAPTDADARGRVAAAAHHLPGRGPRRARQAGRDGRASGAGPQHRHAGERAAPPRQGSERHRRRAAARDRASAGSRHVGSDGRREERSRPPGAVAPVRRARSRQGIHRAGVGTRCRPASASTRAIGRDPSQRQKMSTRARRAQERRDAGDRRAPLQGRVASEGGDRHGTHAPDPRPPERHRPSHRRRSDLRRAPPADVSDLACRAAARTSVSARGPAGVHASARRPAGRVRFPAAARICRPSSTTSRSASRKATSRTSDVRRTAGSPNRSEREAMHRPGGRKPMADPERLTHERVYDGKVFNVDRDRVRMPNGREVTVDVVRHSTVGRPDPGARTRARHPDQAVPVRGEPLVMGIAGRQRGRRRAARGGGAARVPRGDRTGARHHRAPRALFTRRRATATKKCCSSGCRGCPSRPRRQPRTRTKTSSRASSASRTRARWSAAAKSRT